MKIHGERVLIEQIMTKKKSFILKPDSHVNEDDFDISLKILQLGDRCDKQRFKVGDVPILDKFAEADAIVWVEDSEDKNSRKMHIIMNCGRIVGTE